MRSLRICRVWTFVLGCHLSLSVATASAEEVRPNCGPHCLYVAARLLDRDVGDFEKVLQTFGEPEAQGYSLGKIEAIAQEMGLKTYVVKTSADTLRLRPGRFACIAWINGKHFVIINDLQGGQVSVIDPPRSYQIPIETFRTQWDGTSLLLSSEALLSDQEVIRRFGPWRWLPWAGGVVAVISVLYVVFYWRKSDASQTT